MASEPRTPAEPRRAPTEVSLNDLKKRIVKQTCDLVNLGGVPRDRLARFLIDLGASLLRDAGLPPEVVAAELRGCARILELDSQAWGDLPAPEA